MQPAVVGQRATLRVTFKDFGNRRARRLDQHGKTQWLMDQPAAIAHDHTDAADDVVLQLVARPEDVGRKARPARLRPAVRNRGARQAQCPSIQRDAEEGQAWRG